MFDIVTRHAAPLLDSGDADALLAPDSFLPAGPQAISGQQPAMCIGDQHGAGTRRLPSAARSAETEGIRGPWPRLSSVASLMQYVPESESSTEGPLRLPSSSHSQYGPDSEPSASTDSLAFPSTVCKFQDGAFPVSVYPARPKTASRMREKVQEYVEAGAIWPRAACILDPVRASIVVRGADQIMEVAQWFLEAAPAREMFSVCRVKNKFALSGSELVSARARCVCLRSYPRIGR